MMVLSQTLSQQQELILLEDDGDDYDAPEHPELEQSGANSIGGDFDYYENNPVDFVASQQQPAVSSEQHQPPYYDQPNTFYNYQDDYDEVYDDEDDDKSMMDYGGNEGEEVEDEVVFVEEETHELLLWTTKNSADIAPRRTTATRAAQKSDIGKDSEDCSQDITSRKPSVALLMNQLKEQPNSAISGYHQQRHYRDFFDSDDDNFDADGETAEHDDDLFGAVLDDDALQTNDDRKSGKGCIVVIDAPVIIEQQSSETVHPMLSNDDQVCYQSESFQHHEDTQQNVQVISRGRKKKNVKSAVHLPSSPIHQSRVLNRARNLQDKGKIGSLTSQARTNYATCNAPIQGSGIGTEKQIRTQVKRSVSVKRTAKSIVGTRPSHWSTHAQENNIPAKQNSILSQATLSRTSNKTNSGKRFYSSFLQPASTSQALVKTPSSLSPQRNFPLSQKWKEDVNFRSMNFRSNLFRQENKSSEATSKGQASEEECDGNIALNESFSAANGCPHQTPQRSGTKDVDKMLLSAGFRTTPVRDKKGSRKIKSGPIAGQLRSVRGFIDANCARLQSGSYTFSLKQKDVNDPRNRADLAVNVSIIESLTRTGSHFKALGYVHGIEYNDKLNRRGMSSLNSGSPLVYPRDGPTGDHQTENIEESFRMSQCALCPCFALIAFNSETIGLNRIEQGSQLRIYDAVLVPTIPSECSLNHTCFGSVLVAVNLICTQICEIYPASLPSLACPPIYEFKGKL